MTTQEFVAKSRLVSDILEVARRADTGILTILTDTRRSVLLRFSTGKLVQVHCRSRDVGDAIVVLVGCDKVKYTFVPAREDNRAEVMPVDVFLRALAPGIGDDGTHFESITPVQGSATAAFDEQSDLLPQFADIFEAEDKDRAGADSGAPPPDLRDALTRVALNYVGPMATIIVDDAMEPFVSVSDSIQRIASMIPDEVQSRAFLEDANERFAV